MTAKDRRAAKAEMDDKLDSALQDTFPASDPVSFVEPGPATPSAKTRADRNRPPRARRKAPPFLRGPFRRAQGPQATAGLARY